MKTTALIEKGKDGRFGVYTPDIKSTVIGEGATVDEAKADFENSVKEVLSMFAPGEDKGELEGLSFEYKYDTASVFDYLDCINVTKFARFAGICPSLLRGYSRGSLYISEKQAKKIEAALHAFGEQMQAVRL